MAIDTRGLRQGFAYTGDIQTYTVTRAGLYKLEVRGGKGGKGSNSNTSAGGEGGISIGYKYFSVGDVLYIVCGGGNNNTYNGGGNSTASSTAWCGKGGGATHVASVTGTLADIGESNLDKIHIIAGGGGGGGEQTSRVGGKGGGTEGAKGSPTSVYNVYGGTQTKGGYNSYYGDNASHYTHGKFGVGGDAETNSSMPSGTYYGGGGGGGLYGGGGGLYSTNANNNTSGSGGSGYIGGVPEITFNGVTYSPSTTQGGGQGGGICVLELEDVDYPYDISLTYDNTLGSASYEWDYYRETISLTATPNQNSQFFGWYVNFNKISSSLTYTYTPVSNTVIEARFAPIYEITDSVNGQGAISYTRGIDANDVEFNILPNANWHFVKYVVNGSDEYEYTTTPLNLHLTENISITAYFEEDDAYTVTGIANIKEASIYISDNPVYSGTTVTLYARPLADYYFVRWDDGVTNNPREIVVSSSVTMTAIYHRMPEEQNIYSYRCYIKDQLHLTDAPKSYIKVDSFDVKTDLLTNANSTITAIEKLPTNINDGDILVLYDPHGVRLYQGVIKSMQDKQITCSQMQSFYKGNWVFNHHSSSTTLEAEVAYLLGQYAQGKMYGSSWTDTLVSQRLGGINILFVGSTSANLPTDYDYSIIDMEDFIYSLYEDYGIIFSFEINFSGTNYVTIKVPDYETVKVGDNMFAIRNMSPITKTEETNKLIIYSSNNTYRTTYIATTNEIVETPSTNANRFNITNTNIVFSDDPISDIVSANLPSTMYNHKLTFELLIKNFIYEFNEFKLGGSLDVWNKEDYYSTVLTGYEIRKDTNQAITSVLFTCGKVRTALTKKLTMGVVK